MLSISRQNRPLSPARWAARIFAGEIILSPADGAALARQARRIARYFFAPHEPPVAHRFFARGEFFRRAAAAQKRFETDPAVAAAFAALASANGWPSRGLARDRLILRIAPPVAEHAGGAMSHTLAHRDLWGVAIPQQINWWMPIWPVAKNRTLGFWLDFFTRPARQRHGYLVFRQTAIGAQRPAAGGGGRLSRRAARARIAAVAARARGFRAWEGVVVFVRAFARFDSQHERAHAVFVRNAHRVGRRYPPQPRRAQCRLRNAAPCVSLVRAGRGRRQSAARVFLID